MKAEERGGLYPLSKEPRLIDFKLNGRLVELIGKKRTQVVHLLAGGNVPETPKDIAKAIAPEASEAERTALQDKLRSLHDLSPEMLSAIDVYNKDDRTEKKLRFIDTPARIEEQFQAFRANIQGLVNQQVKEGVENIVFTVCGASPPDLQAVRAIQQINEENRQAETADGQKRPRLYAVMFLPGADTEAILDYSVRTGLHPDFWMDAYAEAAKDRNVFIHTPVISQRYRVSKTKEGKPRFADPDNPLFKEVRSASTELFGHNRAGNVDINRSITEFAHRPPIFGVFADSLELPKQLRGSGRELISRMLWMQHFYGFSLEEAVDSIHIVQDGFVYALPWTEQKALELYRESKREYDGEQFHRFWPRYQARRSMRVVAQDGLGRLLEATGAPVEWDNGSVQSLRREAVRRVHRHLA